jgi:UDP-N-acetylglucosamine 1-carboxyvinyltransferase
MKSTMTTTNHLGSLITRFRESQGVTQAELAKHIGTSQSAVARIEKGEQNITVEMIDKISGALNTSLVTLSDQSMNFEIEGGRHLRGSVVTNTSKNAATSLLCASLLNQGKTIFKNMPHIEEVSRILEVLKSIGVSARWIENDIEIKPPVKLSLESLDRDAAMKTRSIIMLAGPLIHRHAQFILPNAGGCNLGSRTIRPHLFALERLGVRTNVEEHNYHFARKKLKPNEVVMYESGDTATENVLLAAARIPGVTTIKLASPNYMVQDLCHFLKKLGVRIDGIGTATLIIHGKEHINASVTYHVSEDPTESMFFIAAALITESELTIKRCPIDFLELELLKLEKMGMKYNRTRPYKARNEHTNLVDITIHTSKLVALEEHIHPMHPGINIDNLPFFAAIATKAEGTTLIHDWVYEKRALYFTELDKLGAQTILADPHRIFITGRTELKGTELVCPPALRPATVILIAMLGAKGRSVLRNVYSINRGYEDLVTRLNAIGAKIRKIH